MNNSEVTIRTYPMPSSAKVELHGKVYVGDPCYIFPNESPDLWSKICDHMFGSKCKEEFNDKNKLRVFEINGIKSYWFGTAFGDGTYDLIYKDNPIDALGVDAGMLSFIPMEIIEQINPELADDKSELERLGHIIKVDDNFFYNLNNGNISVGQYSIDTSGEDYNETDEFSEGDDF